MTHENYIPKSVLITGGTGSFGRNFVRSILREWHTCDRIIVFSRDELKQWEMINSIDPKYKHRLRMFLGDIRDKDRLCRALESVDTVIHAAALKQVPAAEYNPSEFVKTNIIGTQNLIDATLSSGVKRLIGLSTDKAASAANLYGATKLCSDKIIIASNNIKGNRDLKCSVVRYGNVFGSRGSVVPLFLGLKENSTIPITHKDMTRFSITLEQGVNVVINSVKNLIGGEIIVPILPSYRILDIAKAIAPNNKIIEIGIRPGEKIHEEMITETDSYNTYKSSENYIICPHHVTPDVELYKRMKPGSSYNSRDNDTFLTVQQIREILKNNQDKL